MNSSNTTAHGPLHDWRISRTAILAIILGLAIRLYSFTYVPLVNPDGYLYIQQAKALYYGLLDAILSCYQYLSPYPIFISLNYRIFGDWVIAAKVVSLFFGTMTLIPVYWLLRRFYNEITSSLALLCFALIPPLIVVSRQLLRDPVYWFFVMMGLYLFVLHIEKRRRLLTLLSSICFIMGAWARIEGTVFILISMIYLLLTKHEHKWQHLIFFLLPFVVLSLLAAVYQSFLDANIIAFLKPGRLMQRVQGVFVNYKGLRQSLADLEALRPKGFSPEFFPTIRNLLWLIPLGILAVQIVETLFYIFFIILVLGIIKSAHRIPKDSRLIYLVTLSVVALIALYAQMMVFWWMSSRFTVLFLFPAFVFMGAGIEAIVAFTHRRFKLKQSVGYVLICLIVLLVALPKTLRASYIRDKLVFREIGTLISIREKNRRAVSVAGAFKRVRAVHFYANLNYHGAPCFDGHAILWHPDAAAVKSVQEKGYDYFIWDEKGWNKKGLDMFMKDPDSGFIKIKEWRSSRRGRLILYEVRS
jgi:4-amino-4-deoxy-L-arabinose transferase-like glycosyltransferase